MRQQLVMGNWKMNGSKDMVVDLLKKLITNYPKYTSSSCAVFPPAIYLAAVSAILKDTPILWGAQNIYSQDSGAFTGEHSAPMLKEYGCQYVLVGHSERRLLFQEEINFVADKFHHAKDHDIIPVLCVGETLGEREKGLTEQVLAQQIRSVFRDAVSDFAQCVIAYEPVWAIGTGKTATPEEAQAVHAYIRGLIAAYNNDHAQALPIVYGGSVNEKNARALFAMPDIDGGLVGGASLQAEQFLEILTCINS
jgi:triosephosphate isomerase